MKKHLVIIVLSLLVLVGASAFITKSSNGFIPGYTGAPGELTCSGGGGCHKGGASANKAVTISATPSFSLDQYMPDSTYLISIQVAASGFSHFGFGCEILDSVNGNAGLMQNQGFGVHFSPAFNGRTNALHTTPKAGTNSATFFFEWVAPHEGKATIYACGNAVNLNGNTSGDLPIPVSLELTPVPVPVDTTVHDVGLKETDNSGIARITVYPNPANGFSNISYNLKEAKCITVELIDMNGNSVKELYSRKQSPGRHSQILNFQDVTAGVYFIRLSVDQQKVSQKLITVL
jgi:hypothetical protein